MNNQLFLTTKETWGSEKTKKKKKKKKFSNPSAYLDQYNPL